MSEQAMLPRWKQLIRKMHSWYAPSNDDVKDWQKTLNLIAVPLLFVMGPWWIFRMLYLAIVQPDAPDIMISWHLIFVYLAISFHSLGAEKKLTFANKFCGLGFGLMSFSTTLVVLLFWLRG